MAVETSRRKSSSSVRSRNWTGLAREEGISVSGVPDPGVIRRFDEFARWRWRRSGGSGRDHRLQICKRPNAAGSLHAHRGADRSPHERDIVTVAPPERLKPVEVLTKSAPAATAERQARIFSSSFSNAVSIMTFKIAPWPWAASADGANIRFHNAGCSAAQRAHIDHHIDFLRPSPQWPRAFRRFSPPCLPRPGEIPQRYRPSPPSHAVRTPQTASRTN